MKCVVLILIYLIPVIEGYSQDIGGGTVVIARRIGNDIYVGADSRLTWYKSDGTNDTTQMCKIVETDLINMAFQGLYITQAKEIALHVAKRHTDVRKFMQAYVDTFSSYVYQRAETARQNDLPYYTRLRKIYPKNFSHLFLFGNNKDTLFSCMIMFKFQSNESEPVSMTAELLEQDLLYAGYVQEISADLTKWSNWDWNPVALIEKSIRKAETFHPLEVGGDINIVVHHKGKLTWRYRRNSCELGAPAAKK